MLYFFPSNGRKYFEGKYFIFISLEIGIFYEKLINWQNDRAILIQSLATSTRANFISADSHFLGTTYFVIRLCAKKTCFQANNFHQSRWSLQKFLFLMSQNGQSKLPLSYDINFCEGSGEYHQIDIMRGTRYFSTNSCQIGHSESRSFYKKADETINSICDVANQFNKITQEILPEQIRSETLQTIRSRIEHNIHILNWISIIYMIIKKYYIKLHIFYL